MIFILLPAVCADCVDDVYDIPLCTLIALSIMSPFSVSINELLNLICPFGDNSASADKQYNHYSTLMA